MLIGGKNLGPSKEESIPPSDSNSSCGAGENSFQERYGFTKEIFEQVRKSTFIIETGYGISTGWLAKKTGEYLYIATSRHLIYTVFAGIKIGKVAIWRPNIDKDR